MERHEMWACGTKVELVWSCNEATYVDVFTLDGWERFEAHKRKVPDQPEETIELSSSDEEAPKLISLTLQGLAPNSTVKLRAAPTSTVQKLKELYRQNRALESNKVILLHLDGGLLADDAPIQDLDVEDGDIIDVEIK
jgi:Ubiquitin-2 like Rad60 SUMO-like